MTDWRVEYLFAGEGLIIAGDALGLERTYTRDDLSVTIALPTVDDAFTGFEPEGTQNRPSGRVTSWREEPLEYHAVTVQRFRVTIGLSAPEDREHVEIFEETYPIACDAALEFQSWVRVGAEQFWMPARHEGVTKPECRH